MRWIFRVVSGVVVLALLAVAVLFVVPSERIARLATDQFEQATSRALTINGSVRPTVFPSLGVRIEDVALANADWSTQGPMLTAARLDVSVGLRELLGGAVSVERFELVDPVVMLERAADGRANWEMGPTISAEAPSSNAPADAVSTLPDISLAQARIINGTVVFIDAQADVQHRVDALDLTVSLPSLQGRAEATGSALYNRATVEFSGAAEGVGALLNGGLIPVEAQVAVGGTQATIAGNFGMSPLGFQGQLTAQSAERATLFAALGQAVPDLPYGFGRDQIGLDTEVTLASEGSLHLRDMALSLDGNSLRGEVDLVPGAERPKVVATLNSPGLDLSALSASGGDTGTAPAAPVSTGWSTSAIDVGALGLLDAEIALTTGTIGLGDASLDAVSARMVLDRGRAVITLTPIRAYGGTITGEVVVNGRGGLSSRVNLTLSSVQTQPLLTEFLDFERLLGQADVSLDVLAVGTSMAALMSSLEGSGAVSVGRGEILGLDLAGMMRNFDLNFQGEGARTIFDGITGQFSLSQGILTTDNLALAAPLLEALTQGKVNMGTQTLDLTVVPVLLQNAEGAGISVPLRITGPWSAPRIRPDLEAATLQRLNIDGAAIEDNARSAVQRKLSEELNIAPEGLPDGQSIEDAVKERVEDKVRDALGGLFRRN